ncbi:Ubiquitin carboxyl-terminal hydrolase [Lachnellula suecica]|uniref:ubiquitinyl hydrolase 1 n=1 Tax=Lachnellula suecica TaxID=602035 RepID=A0A8T9BUY4_9HELO|nr:Ubiquitin carboxyl-terminal hydrolase [Lachnellula suecica]
MQSHEKQIQDLFDGDPDIEFEYHQDYRAGASPPYTSWSFILPVLLCCLPIVYHILHILDYDLLPLPELLWNCLVYLTPARLLDTIEAYQSPLRLSNPDLQPRTHAAKSEAMRRMNIAAGGLDGKPAGLGNWDNSCYQNSVLQGLASLHSLSGYLTNPAIKKRAGRDVEESDMKMAEALKGLIETLNDPDNNGKRIWTPAILKNMSSWQQQDAQEYFSKVLDEIDKEVGMVAKTMKSSRGFESPDSRSSSSDSFETPLSSYRNPLEGLIAQRVGCTKCGYSEGLSMIPFNCLTVPLGRAFEHAIPECLDEYTKLEQIEGVECGKCTLLKYQRLLPMLLERAEGSEFENNVAYQQTKDRLAKVMEALEDDDYEEKTLKKCNIPSKSRVSSTKSRQAVIARPPNSLVVHFNRSLFDELTGELRKNYSEVRFPKLLDLGPWCLGSSGTNADGAIEGWLLNPDKPMVASSRRPSRLRGPIYELRAVVTHYGRHENGHYICYRKHPPISDAVETEKNEQWWRLSDDDVMKVSEENVLGQGGVFMLFYDRIEPATPAIPDMLPRAVAPLEPAHAVEKTISSEVAVPAAPTDTTKATEDIVLAANIPLPDLDDSDLSSVSDDETIFSESVAPGTSVSEFDDEESTDTEHNDEYQPAKAILVPPYIPQSRGNRKKSSSGSLEGSTGSLLMV